MKNHIFSIFLFGIITILSWHCSQKSIPISNSTIQNPILTAFKNPPNEAKPRVWWHWMNGNVTKDGIQKDLEWMERTGIGGFHNFDANLFTPLVTDKKLVFMTPEWKEAFKFTTDLAIEKGMEMTIAGSPGWSVTGGPWVEPKDGMKKYVWTETRLQGGKVFTGKLPQPANVIGNFQNVPTEAGGVLGGFVGEQPKYYQDAKVFAYRLPDKEKILQELNPKVSSSGGDYNLNMLTDGDLHHAAFLPPVEVGKDAWIQYEFATPQTFKAFTVSGTTVVPLAEFNGNPENRSLQVSNDGVNFRTIAKVSGSIVPQNTVSIPSTTAKYWRMTWETLPPAFNPFLVMAGLPMGEPKPEGVNVSELVLHTSDRIDQFEDKAGFSPWSEDTPTYLPKEATVIEQDEVIDLTSFMQADGSIHIKASTAEIRNSKSEIALPVGNWILVRFGYSLTGRQNHPASPEATGLEVDKLDEVAVRKYINHYLDLYQDATGGKMGKEGLSSIILDSYEAGHMTWTHDFPEEFQKRRGYTIAPWFPVLTGRIVKSTTESEQFLWDFRKTIGEMIVENHYNIIGEELHKRGMKRYTESHENKRIYLADGMDVKRNADIPMSAMWTPGSLGGGTSEEVRSEADIREAASVAHIYGKPYVAAESMTSVGRAFQEHPARLKRTADLELASGLNRFVIHTSVHQPLDNKMPGFSLGPFGQYFTRQETWSGAGAKAWIDYLARSSYLLQQGDFVADALIYYGENTNLTWAFKEALPEIAGYEYDFVNATALQEVLKVENGKITTPGGGSYSVLVLDKSAQEMTMKTLRKLRDLVNAGAKVTGQKPQRTPSLADDKNEFEKLVGEIWSSPNVSNKPATEVLKKQGIAEDVLIKNNQAKVLYVHRRGISDVGFGMEVNQKFDIYWLDSRSAENNSAEISFRTSGKVPYLWHPETGKVEEVSWRVENGRTIIPLDFAPWEAVFIVFQEATNQQNHILPKTTTTELTTISSPWQVSFQTGRSAPANAIFSDLQSWTENENTGIKYFSGTATYKNNFELASIAKGSKILLDLGTVKELAEVSINGQKIGTLWKAPFKIDITDAVKKGENQLEIAVTNVWANRLIGDAQPDIKEKITFTTMPFNLADSPLHTSGLLGPVRINKKE